MSQQQRLIVAAIYAALFLGLAAVIQGLPPPSDVTGLWFWAAVITIVLAAFLTEPFFTRPADAIAGAITLAVAVLSTERSGSTLSGEELSMGGLFLLFLSSSVLLLAAASIMLKDRGDWAGRVASITTRLVRTVGQSRFLYTVAYIAAVYAAFANDAPRVAAALAAWMLVFWARPAERVFAAVAQIRRSPPSLAVIEGIEDPSVLHLRLPRGETVRTGDVVRLGTGTIGIVVDATQLAAQQRARVALGASLTTTEGELVSFTRIETERRAIGLVSAGTSFDELHVRTIADPGQLGLTQGCLLEVGPSGNSYLYLVTAGRAETRAEPGTTRNLTTVIAKQIGRWDAEVGMFDMTDWPPPAGAAVFLAPRLDEPDLNPEWIGVVPGTAFGTAPKVDELVTHNTAILGVLGIGKTSLAVQLIRRMIAGGVKVVVLDITKRYAFDFRDIYSQDWEATVNDYVRRRVEQAPAAAAERILRNFLAGESRLLIINPSDLLTSNRPMLADATRSVSEALLKLAQETFPAEDPDGARYCLILEEAHSLIPESTSTIDRSEINAVNGTARAILQGRKYGLGCVVITQRSANVAKSILNQCNTTFGMRMYDETGMNFLSNYVGLSFAGLLPTLKPKRTIAFGRGIRSSAPVIVDVHDGEAFKQAYWDPVVPEIPLARAAEEEDLT